LLQAGLDVETISISYQRRFLRTGIYLAFCYYLVL
jgi:hypothetical protein